MRKGVQIYTLRDFTTTKESYFEALQKIKKMGYDSVQTYIQHDTDIEHKKILDDLGLISESANADFEEMLANPDAICKAVNTANVFGTDLIAVGTLPESMRDSEDGFHRYVEGINQISRAFKTEGKKIIYHAHALEFFSLGKGKNGMDILIEETDPDTFWFAMDTHWIQSGGKNPADYIMRLKGRVPMVHFKDYKIVGGAELIEHVQKAFCEVGEGNLDWKGIIEACRASGVKSAVVEQDTCPADPFDSLQTSITNMVSFGL